ncbi:MAG: hypothetical protein ACRDJI_01875, partial [Actinomycetota bacterium]
LMAWLLLAALIAVAASGLSKSVDASQPVVGALQAGEKTFWMGEYLRRGSRTYTYRLELLEAAEQLQVAIDVPSRTDEYTVQVIDPSGRRATRAWKAYGYSAEAFVRDPRPGLWRIEVRAKRVTDAVFRMRASLTDSHRAPDRTLLLAPDLRIIPPFGFTFSAPDDGAGSDYDNDPRDGYPPAPVSCAPDETLEQHGVRCIRFSAGIENAGAGPLDLRFDTTDPKKRMYQVLHYSDGSHDQRRAGGFHYHNSHGHFHYRNAWTFKLFRVTDREKGALEQVASGRKEGFCPADQRIADWWKFSNGPAYSVRSDCGMRYEETPEGWVAVPKEGRSFMGFTSGWGDVYGWYRPGNYVELGVNTDGYYVIRAIADQRENVREASERNNASYALIKIVGQEIKVLERGRGTDPWDAHKVVIRDWWRGHRD